MSIRTAALALSAVLPLFAVGTVSAEPRTVHIQVDGDSKFEVIYHRAKSNGTGAAIGGLLGAGIQAGIEADKDGKKREELSPHMSATLWKETFLPALEKALTAKEHTVTWIEPGTTMKPGADLYLILYPGTHGFRMVDTSNQAVSAYVEFTFGYAFEAGKNIRPTKENFYLAGKKQSTFESIVANAADGNQELDGVHAQAAQRLANKLIYNVKR